MCGYDLCEVVYRKKIQCADFFSVGVDGRETEKQKKKYYTVVPTLSQQGAAYRDIYIWQKNIITAYYYYPSFFSV